MKVLKPGDGRQGWAIEDVCDGEGNGGGGCGAKLLVEEGDLYRTESHARDETTGYLTYRCASCGVENDIENTDNGPKRAPDSVWVAASHRKRPRARVARVGDLRAALVRLLAFDGRHGVYSAVEAADASAKAAELVGEEPIREAQARWREHLRSVTQP